MILHDVSIYGDNSRRHIHIRDGKIKAIARERNQLDDINHEPRLELNGAIVLPGFINSHDHLDFNLYPPLANRIYNNYTEWGADIHVANADMIKQVQKIPKQSRLEWGLYKNLLNGFTTVVNHGEKLSVKDDLITVFQDCNSLHSPAFEKKWKWKLNNPFKTGQPIVMHVGEGTDQTARDEIDEVIRGNFIRKKIIAVHGVAMNEKQAESFEGLVWCPASNYFLLHKTADAGKLKKKTKLVFGTDSTLTAPWNSWEHFRQAISSGMVEEKELVAMLTAIPAGLWKMQDRSAIIAGKTADIVILKKTENFFNSNPGDILMVIHNGNVRLIDDMIDFKVKEPFGHITINGFGKRVQGGLSHLTGEIKKYFPSAHIPFEADHE
jgi:cytosine/adenosine deaminase-related metal-dependent hydrolase